MRERQGQGGDLAWFRDGDIDHSLNECIALTRIGLTSGVYPEPLAKAGLTLFLIHLSDLLQKADDDGYRVAFTNDLDPEVDQDVTNLIRNARNAACHVSSRLHMMDAGKLTFCMVRGYQPRAIVINGLAFGCDYPDDTALLIGTKKVYLKRHLMAALTIAIRYFRVRQARPKALLTV